MRGLDGKVAVVAGGGSGIGAATAARLAEEGASVVVGDIVLPNAEAVAAEIREAGAPRSPPSSTSPTTRASPRSWPRRWPSSGAST